MKELCEIRRRFKKVNRIPVMLYEPKEPGERSKVAVIVMHSNGDYIETPQGMALAYRGYRSFAAHVSASNLTLDQRFNELDQVVRYARKYPGVEKVVLLGHSGGATLMSGYQAVYEKGEEFFQRGSNIIDLDSIGKLSGADGVMLIDSNFGNGVMTLLSLDAAITDESDFRKRDPEFDLFDPANGYDENGSHYTREFVDRYVRAQGARMNRLIDYAQSRIRAIENGEGMFEDDEPMIIPGAEQMAYCNKFFPELTEYFSRTTRPYPLIHQDDSVTEEVVYSVRKSRPMTDATPYLGKGTLVTTVRNFLKSSAVRAFEDIHYDETTLYGVDWTSSYCVTVGNVTHITVPMLIMGLTGGYEYIAAEHIYDQAVNCSDKTIAFVEGATHNFCAVDEKYGDTVSSCFNYVAEWLEKHYVKQD